MKNLDKFCGLEKVLAAFENPAPLPETIDCAPVIGSIWEVATPCGEVLEILIVEQVDAGDLSPFEFVRAIPLTVFARLTDIGDALIAIDPHKEVLVAHCWLEGPVLLKSLVRCIGTVAGDCLIDVFDARNATTTSSLPESVSLFRQNLFEQFDPLFNASWHELYRELEDIADQNESLKPDNSLAVPKSLLARENDHRAMEQPGKIAADVREVKSQYKNALDGDRGRIDVEPTLGVRLALDSANNAERRLSVIVVGPKAKINEYRFAEISLYRKTVRSIDLKLGRGSCAVDPSEIEQLEGVYLIDVDGVRHQVKWPAI